MDQDQGEGGTVDHVGSRIEWDCGPLGIRERVGLWSMEVVQWPLIKKGDI